MLVEALKGDAQLHSLDGGRVQDLGDAYEQINAPFGQLATDTLTATTRAIESGTATDDSTYTSFASPSGPLATLLSQRNTLAASIRDALYDAAFNGQKIDEHQAKGWIDLANDLLDQAHSLAASP